MSTTLDDAALLHNQDQISLLNGAQTMRDHQRGTALHHMIQCALDVPLGLGIQRGSSLIQNKHRRVLQQRTSNGQALSLAA